MKKLFNNLFTTLVFVLTLAGSYFYLPASTKDLNQRINQSSPLVLDENRLALVRDYADFFLKNLPENNPPIYFYWYSGQRKLADLRIKQAISEIKSTQVPAGEMRIWSLLNMGAVIKTNEKIIAIDSANLPFSWAQRELAQLADIFIVSHVDGDHFDALLLKTAADQDKKIVLLEGLSLPRAKQASVINLSSGQSQDIDGVKITAYQTDHRGDGNFDASCAWFVIETDGFKLLHTGDGREFKNKDEKAQVYATSDFDVLLANNQLHPYNLRDLQPKVLVPLHLFKFMSGEDLYLESTIETVLRTHQQYEKDLLGIKKIYLLAGESFSYPLATKEN